MSQAATERFGAVGSVATQQSRWCCPVRSRNLKISLAVLLFTMCFVVCCGVFCGTLAISQPFSFH